MLSCSTVCLVKRDSNDALAIMAMCALKSACVLDKVVCMEKDEVHCRALIATDDMRDQIRVRWQTALRIS